jgi:hypothetical protein
VERAVEGSLDVSRNLGRVDCYFCDGLVVHDEPPRPITRDEAGGYFAEYEGMLVANAHCAHCEGKYLAWVRGRPNWSLGHLAYKNYYEGGHIDLSFRSTFDDEPGEEDKPVYTIARCRIVDGQPVLLAGTEAYRTVSR